MILYSLPLISNSTSTEQIEGINKYIYAKGQNVGAAYVNDDFRSNKNAESNNYIAITDQNIDDSTTIKSMAYDAIVDAKSSDNEYGVNIHPSLTMDKFDGINLIDATIGVSRPAFVSGFAKNMDVETGVFLEDLIMKDK